MPAKIKGIRATNRIKVLLTENQLTNNWLAEQLDINCNTVSRWCTNSYQPPLDSLARIAVLLNVDIRDLVEPTKKLSIRKHKQLLKDNKSEDLQI